MTSTITPPTAPPAGAKDAVTGTDARPWDDTRWTESEAASAVVPSQGSVRWAAALATPIGPLWHRTWFRAVILGLVLLCIAVAALVGIRSEAPAGMHSRAASPVAPSLAKLNPHPGVASTVAPGWAFQLGHFRVRHGWHIKSYGAGIGYVINSLEVRNASRVSRSFVVGIKLHLGRRVVANLSCSAVSAPAHQTMPVVCTPDGTGDRYDRVTIQNTY